MAPLATILTGLSVLLTYFVFKHSTLKSSGELQDEIRARLQPRYSITEPMNSEILPHTNWPPEDFYFEAWHVEVAEERRKRWKKWLPRGKFRGKTIIHYKVHGHELPPQGQLNTHRLAIQPYVQSLKKTYDDENKIKVIYQSVSPSSISLFAEQFKYLLRDSTFRQLNPEANLQHEVIKDQDGNLYARFFDSNRTDDIVAE